MKMVVFDLGGVMVRIAKTWGEAAATAGYPGMVNGHADFPLSGFTGFEPFQAGVHSEEEFLDDLRSWLGVPSSEVALAIHQGILIEPYPGTLELVQSLHHLGIGTGCLSNTNAPHWHRMSDHAQFPAIASLKVPGLSHEMRAEKPNPDIYHAFESISGVNGRDIVFFDDLMANVEGAKACGWRAHRIDPSGDTADQMRLHLSEYGICV